MSDRKALIRLASTLPKGSKERKAILAGLKKTAAPNYKIDERVYLKDPTHCPYCGSRHIEARTAEVTDGLPPEAHQKVKCDNCGGEWVDWFKLDGVKGSKQPTVDVEDLAEAPTKDSPMGRDL